MRSEKGLRVFFKSKLFSLLLILVAIIVIFTVWSAFLGNSFISTDTLISIIDLLVVTSFLAIGSGMLLIGGGIDLSAYVIGAMGGIIMSVGMKNWGLSWPIAIILSLVICGACGVLNAVLVNEFNFQPFIATMATASIIKGFTVLIALDPKTNAASTININNGFTSFIGTYKIGGIIPVTVVIMLIAFIIYGLILSKTKFGLSVYLVGGNPVASRLAGLNPKKTSYILFTNSAILASVSGIVYMARTQQGNVQALSTNMFTGLTAAMLGGIGFGGGSGGIAGVFIGLMILNTFNKGMTFVRFDSFWSTVLTGVVLIAALTFDYYNTKNQRQRTLKKEASEKIREESVSGR